MSDISDDLNGLNSSLHGQSTTVFQLFDNGSNIHKNSDAMENHRENVNLGMSVNMSEYLEEYYYLFEEVKHHVLPHHTNLENNFKNCFPELTLHEHEWV
jgi:archaellum component FlaC